MALRRALVVAGGEPPPERLLPGLVRDADLVLAVDGGLTLLQRNGLVPDLVIGDLDSLRGTEVPPGIQLEKHPREKDATDLELALEHLVPLAPQEVVLVGALGGRLDHLVATLSLLERYPWHMVLYHRDEVLYATSTPISLPHAAPGDRVSLLPLTQRVEGIHTQGLRYPLRGEELRRGSTRGVSNQVVSLPCGVRFSQGRLLVVHGPACHEKEG